MGGCPGLHAETPHNARVRVSDFRTTCPRRESFSHVRTSRCGEGRRDLREMSRVILRTSLADESVLVRPTAAQKPEPGAVSSGVPLVPTWTPSQHWHPAIWERACMVLDAFPSLYRAVYRSDLDHWLLSPSRPLPLPPSHRQTSFSLSPPLPFLLPPHRCDDDHHHWHKAEVRCCMWFDKQSLRLLLLVSCVFSLRCLSICVAYQMPRSDMAVVKANKRMARYHLIMHAHVHSRESADLMD